MKIQRKLSNLLLMLLLPPAVATLLAPASVAVGQESKSPADTSQALGIGLESYAYPYPVQFMDITIQGQPLRMAYMDVSASGPASGRTVVLMHGKNMGGYYWANTIDVLRKNGFRVIVPDQIGWGKSSKPDIRYSFDLLAANTKQLLDHLSIRKVAVIAHSTGGMLAVRFARTYPEMIEKLILEDPIGLEDYRRNIPPQSDDSLFQQELGNTDPQKIRAFFARYFVNQSLPCIEPLADVVIRVTHSGEWPRWAKASALTYQMIYQQPVIYEYDLLQRTVLIIVGDHDHAVPGIQFAAPEVRKAMGNFPELAQQAAKRIPKGSAIVVPNCGHIPHLEQPAVFHDAVLKFLAASEYI
jgi:pimeloyl-ACP methyl ester carboxylesterase